MSDHDELIATEYSFRSQFFDHRVMARVTVRRMVSPFYVGERWAVRDGQYCLSTSGEWEYEPIPSSRDDAFYERCRFTSLDEAVAAYHSLGTP